MERLINLTVK